MIPLGFNLQPSDYESHAPATQPQTLSNLQTVALNNAENRWYEVSNATDRDYKQVNTVRINKVRINKYTTLASVNRGNKLNLKRNQVKRRTIKFECRQI